MTRAMDCPVMGKEIEEGSQGDGRMGWKQG